MSLNDIHSHEVAGNNYHDISSGETTNYFESALRLMHGEVVKWAIEKDNVADGDLYFRRYVSGVLQDAPIKIDGANGEVIVTNSSAVATATGITALSINQTLTGASAVNQIETFQAITTSDVQTGDWCNAVFGKIDYSTNGKVTGLAGVVCAEIDMPNSNTGGAGTYSCFESEINCPTNLAGGSPIHVFQINAWGAGVAQFDATGYLFDLTGVSSGAGSIWYDNQKAAPAVEEFIRVKTPSGVRYLALYDANA